MARQQFSRYQRRMQVMSQLQKQVGDSADVSQQYDLLPTRRNDSGAKQRLYQASAVPEVLPNAPIGLISLPRKHLLAQ